MNFTGIEDFSLTDGNQATLEIALGISEVCESLTVVKDSIVEGDEFLFLDIKSQDFQISNPSRVQITIFDSNRKFITISINVRM